MPWKYASEHTHHHRYTQGLDSWPLWKGNCYSERENNDSTGERWPKDLKKETWKKEEYGTIEDTAQNRGKIALISRETAQCVYFQGERGWKENRGVQRPMIQKRSTRTIF